MKWNFSLTSKTHKKAEEHRVEKAEADGKNILVDHRRNSEDKQHGRSSETLLSHLERT